MIHEMFIQAQVQIGEAELALRIKYASNPLTHAKRMHRRQGVWGAIHNVCVVRPTDHTPILTTYNQSRQTNHR